MASNFAAISACLVTLGLLLERRPALPGSTAALSPRSKRLAAAGLSAPLSVTEHPLGPRWLPPESLNPAKRATEVWFLQYGAFWIFCFAIIIGLGLYRRFDAEHYMIVCVGLALPLLLQPLLAPGLTLDDKSPFWERYSTKANAWIAVFAFIGNYWYTHYFYSVLGASYTFPSWDVNGVPIPMFFATHFYFSFYHTLSNCALRRVESAYCGGIARFLFSSALVGAMSYATAFMETLTISGFPCYRFEDWHRACTVGSAFYGIYFLVSFPMFRRVDELGTPDTSRLANGGGKRRAPASYSENSTTTEWTAPAHLRKRRNGGAVACEHAEALKNTRTPMTLWQSVTESLAAGMIVLCLLDFVRVWLGEDMHLRLSRPCKSDASLTCAPFTKTC
jgi:cycloeucalenol cycloisomerase